MCSSVQGSVQSSTKRARYSSSTPRVTMATAKADNMLLVAAIDIGTTFSGFAFSFLDDFKRDPLQICTNFWPGHGYCKAPTALLLTKNKEFHSFGYDAEDKYYELVDEEEQNGWYFFRRFKMTLHGEGLKKTTELKDEEGKPFSAIEVFRHSIWFLKDTLLKEIDKRCPSITALDIHWVITVPAIWNDAAKQFMRLAAQKAGIPDNMLTLALEPEAASIYCKLIPTQRMTSTSGRDILACFQAGYRYLIADLGGGTADVTAHQVASDFKLKQIHEADGGDWGGVHVDDKFVKFLLEIFGNESMEEFRTKYPSEFLDLTRDFEAKKKKVGETDTKITILSIPVALTDIVRKKNFTLQTVIENSKYGSQIIVKGNKIKINNDIVKGFFQETVNNIGRHIQKILSYSKCANIQMILMVGGFSESAFVRHCIRDRFPNIRIVVPQDAGMSVLKGAVLYGHAPNVVVERICRWTYGIDIHYPYIDGRHLKEKLVEIDGERLCKDRFEKFVSIGDSIRLGEMKIHEFHDTFKTKERKHITEYVKVYTSSNKSPEYVTDKTCNVIGKIEINPPNGGWPDIIEGHIEMQFGGTEFKVKVIDDTTQMEYSASFDFLV